MDISIIIALVIAVIVVIVLLVMGWWLLQRRKIHLETPQEQQLPQKSGKELYQAKKDFSFLPPPTNTVPVFKETQPNVPEYRETKPSHSVQHEKNLPDNSQKAQDFPSSFVENPSPKSASVADALPGDKTDTAGKQSGVDEVLPSVGDDASVPLYSEKPEIKDVRLPDFDADKIEEEVRQEDATDKVDTTTATPRQETSPSDVPSVSEIEPTQGRFDRLRGKLAGSQSVMSKSILGLLGGTDLDEESWEDIEDALISADVGTTTALRIVATLREAMAAENVKNSEDAKRVIAQVLINELHPEWDRSVHAVPIEDKPAVVLVVGVNGTGKTSTSGKLARVLISHGISVHFAAADTFRAAAADQLALWAKRSGATITRGPEAADPSSVAFDGVAHAIEQKKNAVIVDTAGRLHNKVGLMDELAKIKRVIEKQAVVTEVLLVLDATIGQNGLAQAKTFAEMVNITGVVLTKLDGTAKGGIVFQVQNELGTPLKLVGLGEGVDDLAPFDPEAFVHTLLG